MYEQVYDASMKALIIEDNQKLALYIQEMLSTEHFIAEVAHDGQTGERLMQTGAYDVVILDRMLPEKGGVEVTKSVRAAGNVVPILMLTALGEVEDKILGLDSGADDYLVKPFAMEELLARVRSLLRRPASMAPEVLTVRDISLDSRSHTVTKKGEVVSLTTKEYAVLEYLLRKAGTVVTREQLLDHCWDFAYSAFSNITDVYIKQIRQKLGEPHEHYIKTIRGVGYLFSTE